MKQKTRLTIKYLISAVIFISVFISLSSMIYFSSAGALYSDTLEEELEDVKQQRENTQKEIEKTKKAEAEYVAQVNQVEENLVTALSELEDLNGQLSSKKTEVDKLTVQLVIKKEELEEIENVLKEKTSMLNSRVALIYKNRQQDVLQLFFESEGFLEFFSKLKLMNMVAQQDFQILKEVQETRDKTIVIKDNIEALKDEERQQKQQLENLVSEAENKKREIEGIFSEKQSLLSKTRANKEALIKMEQNLAAKENEITKKLEALRYGNAPGKLAYPVRGILTSGFGYRINPITGTNRFHGGIDIGASSGTQVISAAAGEVLQAEYMGGYGYAILIYHGGGFATFYAHLSGFAVSAGQKVKQGQIIGYVGSTGFTTGPHLHFEVRVNGAQQNPYSYF